MTIWPPADPWRPDGTDPEWQLWFAWYPVVIDGVTRWMRWVETRMAPDMPPPHDIGYRQYRLPQADRGCGR